MPTSLHIKTPGRICLFGDHQDYLGLPVIACAIDRYVSLSSEENKENSFNIHMPDIRQERRIPISETLDPLEKGDHLASALRVVRRYGCHPSKGFDVELRSSIPINAGVSSSSAIVVAWTHFLLIAFGCNQEVTPSLIAQLAYEAEVEEHNSPGGKMDQYTVSLGGLIYIDTSADFSVKTIESRLPGLVLGVSGIPKKTIGLLGELRGKAQTAISAVKRNLPDFQLKDTSTEDIEPLLHYIAPELRPYFSAAVNNHSITQKAVSVFDSHPLDPATMGKLMNDHHLILKDVLKITIPRIDAMIEAALKAGAYGAKIVGSGGGGSIVALGPAHQLETIRQVIMNAGAFDAYEVKVVGGSKKIESL